MKVETYEEQEILTEPFEATEEALSIVDSCGLEGQKKLFQKKTEDNITTTVHCPYRMIKKEEQIVYSILCPQQTIVENFAECPIPLRVLQIISHAKSFEIFKCFWVWSAEGQIKDPVLVAYTGKSSYGSPEGDCYILARWGEELAEWNLLVKKAFDKWINEVSAKAHTIKSQLLVDIEQIGTFTPTHMFQRKSIYYSGF